MRGLLNDDEMINALKNGGRERERALSQLYDWREVKIRIFNYVKHYSGTKEEAHEIFIETILAVDRNVRNNRYNKESTLKTYFFSIAKYCFHNYRKTEKSRREHKENMRLEEIDYFSPELIFIEKELGHNLKSIMQKLTDECRKILNFWSLSYNFSEMSTVMESKNPNQLRKKKFLCMKKLAQFIYQNPDFLPDHFYENL